MLISTASYGGGWSKSSSFRVADTQQMVARNQQQFWHSWKQGLLAAPSAGPLITTSDYPGRLRLSRDSRDSLVTILAAAESQDGKGGGSGTDAKGTTDAAATTDASASTEPSGGDGSTPPRGDFRVSLAGVFRSEKDKSGADDKPSVFQWGMDHNRDIYGSEKNTLLFEVGTHSGSFDSLLDLGLAYRRGLGDGPGDYIVGGNLFVDHNLTGERTGGSAGIEFMAPGLASLHSNFYMFFDEGKKDQARAKTDNGFDVSLKTALTMVPALALEARYSYWFAGKSGAANKKGESKKDKKLDAANGTTLGLSWQPIPLVKLSASHTFMSTKNNKTQVLMEFQIGLGQPFHSQLQPLSGEIAKDVLARNMRTRFVNRDPVLVAEYPVGIGGKEGLGEMVLSSWAADAGTVKEDISELLAISEGGIPEQALLKGDAAVVVAQARYANGQPVPGVGVRWKLTPEPSKDGVEVYPGIPTKTNAQGRVGIAFTNKKAEDVTVDVSFDGQ